jgi:hypothetical protein
MNQGNGTWLKADNWHASHDEIHRFLDTWYFYISITGHLYARPLRQSVNRRDIRAFLMRLDVLGRDLLPETMTFDFTKILMSSDRWRRISELLRQYAARINSASFIIFNHYGHGGIALIPRSVGQSL